MPIHKLYNPVYQPSLPSCHNLRTSQPTMIANVALLFKLIQCIVLMAPDLDKTPSIDSNHVLIQVKKIDRSFMWTFDPA